MSTAGKHHTIGCRVVLSTLPVDILVSDNLARMET